MNQQRTEGRAHEYRSGEVVEPGLYRDLDTGATVRIHETDELPDGTRVVRVLRRFQRVEEDLRQAAAA